MTRGQLLLSNAFAALLAVAAAWFALNAAELARHAPLNLARSTPPTEKPPLPPAARSRAPDRMSKTTPTASLRFVAAQPLGNDVALQGAPGARMLFSPPVAPQLEPALIFPNIIPAPENNVIASLELVAPLIDDYKFSARIRAAAMRSDRTAAVGEGDPGLVPRLSPAPLRRPKRRESATARSENVKTPEPTSTAEEPQTPTNGRIATAAPSQSTEERVAAAATHRAPEGGFKPTEGMILLGVFQSRTGDRALIRTASRGVVTVTPGDDIEGWRVAAINNTSLQLRRASQTRLLELPGNAR